MPLCAPRASRAFAGRPALAALVAVTVLIAAGLLPSDLQACGVERWSVKTGTDADAGLVNLASPQPNTIATMAGWTAPNPIPPNNRVSPQETTVWVLNVTLTQYKLESDQDYHLILSDGAGHTLIAEIPDPACVGGGSPFASGISNARAEFDAKFTATTSFQTANVPVQITGVGMFDFLHGQTGVAPNGIELHPVLDIIFNPGSNPDFAISASPGSLSAAQGNSASTTVSTTVSGGFNSAVSLSASGVPSGASATFSPTSIAAPGAGSSTLTLAAGTAAAGTYTVTVTGSGGGKTHSTTVSFTITAAATPDFALSVSPASLSAAQGGSATTTVSTTVSGGFNSAVSLSASGVPSGGSATFNPASIAAPGAGSSTLTLAAGTAAAGTYTVTVTGSGGGKTHSATVSFTVTSSGSCTPGELFTDNGFESGTAPAGTTGTSGTSGPWVWTSSGNNNPVHTSGSGHTSHAGTWLAWMNGYGSTETDTIYQQAAIPAGATATLTFWLRITTSETTTTAQNDKLQVQVLNTANSVLATLATYSNLNASSSYAQKSIDVSAYAGQTIRIKFTASENSSLATSFLVDDVSLAVTCPSGDTIPPTTSITAPVNGATVSGTANVTATASDNVGVVKIEIYVDGALQASNANATSLTFAWNTTTVANGTHTLQSKAYDAAGNVGTSATVSVTVANSTGSQQLLGNPGFENGSSNPSPWVTTTGVINNSSSEPPHSGSWDAWLDGYGTTHTDTVQQTVTIAASVTTATLSFWLHIDTAETSTTTAFDTLTVQIRNSSGTVLATLATYSNLDAAAGYAQKSFDVSSFKGQTIQVYLVGAEDSTLQTSFVVDDFALNVQ